MLAVLTEPNVNIQALLKTSATNVNTLLRFSSLTAHWVTPEKRGGRTCGARPSRAHHRS